MAIEIQEDLLGYGFTRRGRKRPANLPRRISAVNKRRREAFEKCYSAPYVLSVRPRERSEFKPSNELTVSEEEFHRRLEHWKEFFAQYPTEIHDMIVSRQIYFFKPFTREEFFVVRQYEYLEC